MVTCIAETCRSADHQSLPFAIRVKRHKSGAALPSPSNGIGENFLNLLSVRLRPDSAMPPIYPLPSVRKSRLGSPKERGSEASLAGLVVHPAQSCGTCGAMPRREAVAWITGPAQPSGTRIAQPGGLGLASWRSTLRCENMWNSAFQGRSPMREVSGLMARR